LDGGAFFYDCYLTRDGKYLSIGALEPKFFAELLRIAELDPATFMQRDPSRWSALRAQLARVILQRNREEWTAIFGTTDACVAPVLSIAEAPGHAHNVAREVFIHRFGLDQPAPAPRFSETPSSVRLPPPRIGEHTRDILSELGVSSADIDAMMLAGECADAR
jgi:alpha-methylacyl-CoA racemase